MRLPLSTTRRIDALLPKGTYRLRGEACEAMQSSEETGGKVGLRHLATVVEPEELAGASVFDKFWLGTNDDPACEHPETYERGFGGRRHKTMLEACGIVDDLDYPTMQDVAEALTASYAGQEYCVDIRVTTQKETNRDGSPNAYAGQQQNDCIAYYMLGEKEPRITDETWLADQQMRAKRGGGGRAATPAARPIAAAAAPAAAATAPARTAAPATRTPPARTAAKPNGAATAPHVAGRNTIKCSACKAPNNMVYADEWDAHVEQFHPE